MAIGTGWLVLGIWGVRWLFRHSREPADSTARIYSDLTLAAGHGIPAELRVSGKLRQPSIFGILRPIIFIPARYEDANGTSTETIRLSLLHELAHADRADAWFSAAASLAQGIWFFLPQIWWIRSQLMIDQEFLADRSAALAYGTSTKYASSLVSLAGGGSASSSGQFAIVRTKVLEARTSGTPSVLFQRVLMLLYCPFSLEPTVSRASVWLVSSSLIWASLLSACLVVRWPTPTYESSSQSNHHSAEHVFQVAQIIARPQVSSIHGRSLPFILPLALPSSFEISVEVQAAPADLPRIRLVDLPLDVGDTPELATDDPAPAVEEENAIPTWHHIRLQHTQNSTRLSVDGRERLISPQIKLSSQWLTIEPAPEHSAMLRDLKVRW
jgi:hypothetical protein